MPSTSDIEQLQPLEAISRELGVTFTLRGGVAFRFAVWLNSIEWQRDRRADLFNLAPFASDIDLLHSGSAGQSDRILDRILREVTSAECFRWEVRSKEEDNIFRQGLLHDGIIPARLIELSSDPMIGFNDAWGGINDIQKRQFRYIRNGFFSSSPLRAVGRDLEVFSALLYLQTLFEAGLATDEILKQSGRDDAYRVFQTLRQWETARLLQQHSYLRVRLTYLVINALAATSRETFWDVAQQFGLLNYLQTGFPFARYFADRNEMLNLVPVSSACLGGHTLRIFPFGGPWSSGDAAQKQQALQNIRLADSHRILMASPAFALQPGKSPSSQIESWGPMEFIQFALPAKVMMDSQSYRYDTSFEDADLSGILALQAGDPPSWNLLALPCVVQHRLPRGRDPGVEALLIRMNCLGLVEQFVGRKSAIGQFFLVGWTGQRE